MKKNWPFCLSRELKICLRFFSWVWRSCQFSIAHELARVIFKFKRDGFLETLGPAGTNTMNTLCVTSFITIPGNLTRSI